MKIGIFTDSYLPYTSGVVRSIQTFTSELRSRGHSIYIFAPRYKNCSEEEGVFRFASVPSPTNRDFALAVPYSPRFKPTIQRLDLDLIHTHSPFLLGRLGARYARKLGLPLVFTFHTLYDQYVHYVPFARSFTKELAQYISRDFCNQCDLVIVPTRITEDYLRTIGVEAEIKIVPTGIKIEDFQCGKADWLHSRYNIPENKRILLFVGRMGQEKNIDFLLESYSIVFKEVPESVLVLVGSGPEEEELKRKAVNAGIAQQVIFTGALEPREVVHAYASADIFVFSSVTETQGIVIAEAKASGLPVVALKAYGASEMVEDGLDGFLTEPEPQKFAEKICLILKNSQLRHSLSKRARINAEKFSSAHCTSLLLDCYEKLLQNKKSTGKRLKQND